MDIAFQHTEVVNGTEITVNVEFQKTNNTVEELYTFPTLYKIDKLGRVSFWRVYVKNDEYFRESGIEGGKVKSYAPVKATPKNVGRANETTGESQALFEAFSKWKHKKDELYSEIKPVQGETNEKKDGSIKDLTKIRPMLAQKFEERKKYAVFPGAVSPKLDGVRVMIYKDGEEGLEGIKMISRLGKTYSYMDGIREEAKRILDVHDIILDGELYSHNIPFNAISGAVRTKGKPSKYDDLLEYYIFDLYIPGNPNATYKERMDLLRKLCVSEPFKRLRFLYYDEIKAESDLKAKHDQYVLEGYEGLIFRNLKSVYHLGRRSNDLLKYKQFEDEEFKVIDVIEGVGSEKGAAIFVCETKTGDKFSVRPRGSIEKRKIQFKNKNKYIGKMLTVRHQPLTREDVLPRFPVGIKFDPKTEELIAVGIRDYE